MTIQEADKHFIHTYNRSVVFTKGEGMYCMTTKGKNTWIWVPVLLYQHYETVTKKFKQALKDQIE